MLSLEASFSLSFTSLGRNGIIVTPIYRQNVTWWQKKSFTRLNLNRWGENSSTANSSADNSSTRTTHRQSYKDGDSSMTTHRWQLIDDNSSMKTHRLWQLIDRARDGDNWSTGLSQLRVSLNPVDELSIPNKSIRSMSWRSMSLHPTVLSRSLFWNEKWISQNIPEKWRTNATNIFTSVPSHLD